MMRSSAVVLLAMLGCSSEVRAPALISDAADDAATDGKEHDASDAKDANPFETEPLDDCSPSADAGAISASHRDTVLADAPVGYWPLDDAIDAKWARDLGKGAHDATAVGKIAFGVAGAFPSFGNTAARFDGSSYLEVGPFFDFGASSFTIEVWVKPSVLDSSYRFVLGKEQFGSKRQGYELYLRDTETNFLRWTSGAPSGQAKSAPLEVGKWFHLVVRYDAPSRTSSMLVDGLRVSANPDFGAASEISNGASFTFGSAASIGGAPLEGAVLDELAVYDYVLPCARVKAHFASAR